jgi:PAS domain S-box-containing protein
LRLGLRVLTAVLLLAGTVPATILLVRASRENLEHLRAAARDQVASTARLVAQQHQRAVDTARGTLLAVSWMRGVRRAEPAACSETLSAVAAAGDTWANLGVSTLDGRMFCSAFPMTSAVNVADRAWFKGAIRRGGFASGTCVMTRVRNLSALGFGYPVRRDDGTLLGVASASLRVDTLQRQLEALALPRGVDVEVIDRTGVLVTSRSDPSLEERPAFGPEIARLAMAGTQLHEGAGADGIPRVFGFATVEADGEPVLWAVASVPTEVVESPAHSLRRGALATWTAAVLFVVLVAGFLAEVLLVRRFRALARAAARIAAGDYSARAGLPHRADELGELVVAFDDMAGSLDALQRQNRLLLDSIGDGIIGLDGEARVVFANPAAARILGVPSGEMRGRPFSAVVQHAGPRADPCLVLQSLADGRVHVAADDGFTRRDGTTIPVESVTTPIMDGGRIVGAVVALRDASERRRLEEELRQAQKMEAVGQLAGGVAHDFNNLLTAIITCGRMVQEALAPDHPAQPDVDEILASADRAAQLTRQLLAFARRQRLAPRALDLRESVAGMERMLRRVLGETISLTVKVPPEPVVIHADPGQIEMVVLNLAVNARDAMPGGGELELAVGLAEEAETEGAPARPMAELAVRDTGVGMDEDTQDRIFEPFFTTKPSGKGTGLGLATVYGIVKQSDGVIHLRSSRGKGTEFRVLFPVHAGDHAPGPSTPLPVSAGGSERVLVLEDDEVLRTLVCRALTGAGYRVVEAARPSQALARAADGQVDLLVTDLVLPERSGWQLFREIAGHCPGLRIVVMSGFAVEPVTGDDSLPPEVPFLPKPFAPNDLLVKVRQALDGPAPPA